MYLYIYNRIQQNQNCSKDTNAFKSTLISSPRNESIPV